MTDETLSSNNPWNFATRVAFRFFFLYFLLYTLPFPVSMFQAIGGTNYEVMLWDNLVVWVGKTFLELDIEIRPNGSGDTTWNYVQVLIISILAFTGTIVWSLLD